MAVPVDPSSLAERYEAVARTLEGDLMRHSMRLCGGDQDWAQDLVQDALIAGFSELRAGRLELERNVKSWLLQVITNRFINQYNRNKKWTAERRVEDVEAEQAEQPLSAKIEAPDATVTASLEDPILLALSDLQEDQRACVLMVDLQDMSYIEAAEVLKVPVGTVRSRLARGRLKLYSLLLPYAKSRRYVS
jgi:RNA polymerase sigma-70 factor (ECF subfamily)